MKDYDKAIQYVYRNQTTVLNKNVETVRTEGEVVDKNDIIPAGTTISMTVTAKAGSNYVGSVTSDYRITTGFCRNSH